MGIRVEALIFSVTAMAIPAQAAQFHAGVVHFREDAPGELMAELLGFPGVRHDDQVDFDLTSPRVH